MVSKGLRLLTGVFCLWAVAGGGIAQESDLAKRKAALEAGVPLVVVNAKTDEASSSGGKYIRYVERANEAKLQTAIAHFVREEDGVTVDLISVIHVADEAYYDDLDKRMTAYDVVLYEMVGGPYTEELKESAQAQADDSPLAGLGMVHGMIQSLLKLEFQKDGINYFRKNFVHADVDWEKFQSISEERNQAIATWFERAMKLSESDDLPGIPKTEAEGQVVLSSLLASVMSGDATGLKRMLAPILSEAEVLITRLEGEDGTIMVTERNKVALEVLREQVGMGKRKLAVFYGGGHMPDFEKRLIGLGFSKEKTEWLTAWDIRADPSVQRNSFLTDLLQDESIGALLKSAMKLMEQSGSETPEK